LSRPLALRPFVLAGVSGAGCVALAMILPPPGAPGGAFAVVLLVRDGLALLATYAALQLALRRALSPRTLFAKETVQ